MKPGMRRQSRNHHIVPQLYLRRFASGERIVAIEIKTGRILENQNIEEVAFEKHANRPAGVLLDPGIDVEGEISVEEGRLAKTLRDFPSHFPPTDHIRDAVSDFILLQIVRDPRKRTQYENTAEEPGSIKDHQLAALLELTTDPESPLILEPAERQQLREAISERCWHLYEALPRGMAEFITSDSPVYLVDWKQHGVMQHADVHQLFLPLDRHHLLILERGSPGDDRKFPASDSQVLELNRMTAHAARRFAYAHPDINRCWLKSSVYPIAASIGGHVQRP